MSNAVVIHEAEVLDIRLNRITNDIATLSTSMVTDAYRIGSLLNEARELLGSDVEFGRWRNERIEPLGISRRTAARMGQLARAFESEAALPKDVNLSVLYILTSPSTSPRAQDAVLERIEAGEALSTREAERIVAGTNNAIRRKRKDGEADPVKAAEAARKASRRHNKGPALDDEAEAEEVGGNVDPDEAWARNIVAALRNKSAGPRGRRLSALLMALREKGLLRNLDGCTLSVNFRDGVLEVGE